MDALIDPKVSFSLIIESLKNIEVPFPPAYLYYFSDINPKDLIILKGVWPQIPGIRRQTLLEDLEQLSDSDTTLSFEDVAKMALKDELAKVRTLAIRLLWEIEDHKLIPTFIEMMQNDPDAEVRATAASILGIYVFLGEVEQIPAKKLTSIEQALLKVMNSQEDELVRRRALESLGFSSRPEVPELIKAAFSQTSTGWITSSLFAMGRSADEQWEKSVLSQLNNSNEDIQKEAIQAAGELELKSARSTLLDLLDEEPTDSEIWAALVWSLSMIGGEGVRETLEKLEENTDDQEEIDLIADAIDNLSFTEDMGLFNLLDVKPEDLETSIYDSKGQIIPPDLSIEETPKKKKHKKTQ